MSLVLVTGDGPEHRYVANMICATHQVEAILVCEATKRRPWHAVLRKSPTQFVDKTLRELFLRIINDKKRRSQSIRRILGDKTDKFDREDILTRVGKPDGDILTEKISQISPEIIAVYGTGIIPDAVLGLAGKVALNMHTGLSPWYRGTACAFWPIVERKPNMVGATVHECTAKVDGGQIFFRERAALFQGDDLHSVFARSVATGASGYVEVISEALQGGLAGIPQDLDAGREYRGSMLGIRAEIAARWSLMQMSKKWDPPPVN